MKIDIVKSYYDQLIEEIATNRKVEKDVVSNVITGLLESIKDEPQILDMLSKAADQWELNKINASAIDAYFDL